LPDFIANDEWLPIHPTLVRWIIMQVWGNAGVLSQAVTEAKKQFPSLKCTSVDLVCRTGESH